MRTPRTPQPLFSVVQVGTDALRLDLTLLDRCTCTEPAPLNAEGRCSRCWGWPEPESESKRLDSDTPPSPETWPHSPPGLRGQLPGTEGEG